MQLTRHPSSTMLPLSLAAWVSLLLCHPVTSVNTQSLKYSYWVWRLNIMYTDSQISYFRFNSSLCIGEGAPLWLWLLCVCPSGFRICGSCHWVWSSGKLQPFKSICWILCLDVYLDLSMKSSIVGFHGR